MAKRVYELAKELGLDNKEVLTRLRDLQIQAKSYMSILEPAEVEKLKQRLTQEASTPAATSTVEKRVGRTIIRRRTLKVEPPAPEPEPAAPPAPEKPAARKGALKKAPLRKSAQGGTEASPAPEPVPETSPPPPAAAPAAPPPTAAKPAPAAAPEHPRPAEAAPAPPAKRAKPVRPYLKPSIRRTARAVDNMPLPEAKPLKPSEKVVPPPPPSKKKKGKSLAALAEEEEKEKAAGRPGRRKGKPVEAPAKKKGLRRKVAFKAQQGMEGVELMDVGRMYTPVRKKKGPGKKLAPKKTTVTIPKPSKRVAQMGETIVVAELAKRMGVKSRELVAKLAALGQALNPGSSIDYETAVLVATEFQFEVVKRTFQEAKILAFPAPDRPEELIHRPPVVTVMGHVDHGKTSLLDFIRKTRVAEREAGQITQHIGASVVDAPGGRIVFVDTPGHEAFTSMRARGAKVTDLVVLVVAADDGVMPQTREAVNHAQAAQVPIIVAINKIDLPGANPDRIVQELAKLNLTPEEWGGTTMVMKCSAKTGQGVTELLEAILLQAEVMELRANPKKAARGVILESRLDRGKGPVAAVLVQEGTLHVGDPIICGAYSGRARALIDDRGRPLKEVGPSMPAEVLGLEGLPLAGDSLLVVDENRKAKLVSEHRAEELRLKGMTGLAKFTLEDFLRQAQQEEVRQLNVILKTDTQGSLEAIKQALEKLNTAQTKILVIHDGVGGITENDVLLASAGKAVILGFMVRPESSALKLAEHEGVEFKLYQVIYNLLEEMKAALKGMLKPVTRERVLGHAEVRNLFNITKVGTIGGSYVTDGIIQRNAKVRLLRDQVVVYDGKIASLKRLKDDAREVATGLECGIAIEGFNDIHLGDVIESFVVEEVAPI